MKFVLRPDPSNECCRNCVAGPNCLRNPSLYWGILKQFNAHTCYTAKANALNTDPGPVSQFSWTWALEEDHVTLAD